MFKKLESGLLSDSWEDSQRQVVRQRGSVMKGSDQANVR